MNAIIPKFNAPALPNEADVLNHLVVEAGLTVIERQNISKHATTLVEKIRTATRPGIMESFLAEYGETLECRCRYACNDFA